MKNCNGHVLLCVAILGLTASGKILALIHGSGLLSRPHPFLPGNFAIYVYLGLGLELLAFGVLFAFGARGFLTTCLGLSVLFLAYHALEVFLQTPAPCPCLGGLLSHWKPLTGVESTISFLMACGLGIASFTGVFPQTQNVQIAMPQKSDGLTIGTTLVLWCGTSLLIVWFWKDRLIGGDEGMEAAKSLQLLVHPENAIRIWNDQPPLLTGIAALLFKWLGSSLTIGRLLAVMIELLFPLTLAVYWAHAGIKWAGIIMIGFLWLMLPFSYSAFMLEAPAYCVGIAALLPMLLRGIGRWPLFISALIATMALSIKLTAAFALVVPFTWLLQRDQRKTLLWAFLAVALTILGSLAQPGWSWSAMGASHLDFRAKDIFTFRFDPIVYAQGWLLCALAVFAVANRYVRNELAPIVPWLSTALVALLIHLIHRPFWAYYNIHLITPATVLAGVGIIDFWRLIGGAEIPYLQRRLGKVFVMVVCCLWAWQRETEIVTSHAQASLISRSPIVKELKVLGDSGHTAFSINPLWTFAAGEAQTPPELTIIPLKRVWSGQINDEIIVQKLASNHVDAIVLYQNVMNDARWTNLLSKYVAASRDGENILFVRRELKVKAISLEEQTVTLHQLGL